MRQQLLAELHDIFNHRFFQRLESNLQPRIRATSSSKPYLPFSKFLKTIRRIFAVDIDMDGNYVFRYGSQIDEFWWRKTTKKELARRSGLTENQIRTCLRIAEDNELIERRSKAMGTGRGSILKVRPNIIELERMLGPKEDNNRIRAKTNAKRMEEAFKRFQQASVKSSKRGKSDGGNFPSHLKGYEYNTNGRESFDETEIRINPPEGGWMNPKENEGDDDVPDPDLHLEGRDFETHANGSITMVIENGKIKILSEEEANQ